MATTQAQINATRRYEAKTYDFVKVRLPKGTKEKIQSTGESINGFILQAVLEKLNSME